MNLLRRSFLFASAASTLLILLAPLFVPWGGAATALALVVYAIGSVICHQQPERSFHLWSQQLPVCARCTGIYLGAALVAVYALMRPLPESLRRVRAARSALAFAAVPVVLTLAYEWAAGGAPSNATRAISGLPVGLVVATIVLVSGQRPSS